jgi:hypothetical protein
MTPSLRHRLAAPAAAFGASLLALALVAGCGKSKTEAGATAQIPAVETRKIDFKIGIMTGTVSQGEDEFRAAQMLTARFGEDHVRHVTYPDNFMNEQETVIAQLVGLADDPEVKVIIAAQAIPGSLPAVRKIREKRPDILIAFVEPHEDPAMVNAAVDISIQPDQLARGRTIIETAKKMGVTDFIHYSFPRHMSQELLARRRDIMKETCAANGMKFHFVTAPDPMAEGGLAATQQFVTEDVARELKQYGEKTAFFSTNCGMQDPLIRTVLNEGGYVPEQCCPSPTHGYPTALGIAIPPDKAGDFAFINAENKRVIAEHGKSGHFSTWPVAEVIVSIRATADLLADAVEKKADYKDQASVKNSLDQKAGVPVTIAKYDANKGNSYLLLVGNIYY